MKDVLNITFETKEEARLHSYNIYVDFGFHTVIRIKDRFGLRKFTEDEYWLYFDKEYLHIENHPRYISRLFEKPDQLEFFEVFRDQRTGLPAYDIGYFLEDDKHD